MVLINCQIIFGIYIWGHRKVEMRWLDRSGMFSSRFQMFFFLRLFDQKYSILELVLNIYHALLLSLSDVKNRINLILVCMNKELQKTRCTPDNSFFGGGGWRDGGEYHRQKKLEIWRLELQLTSFGVGIWAVREGQWVRRGEEFLV